MASFPRRWPVTTLALAAGASALFGAELFAAGFAGAAALLLLQKRQLGQRARQMLVKVKEEIEATHEPTPQT